jgi:Zn-dependent alcohol dehydrogenase
MSRYLIGLKRCFSTARFVPNLPKTMQAQVLTRAKPDYEMSLQTLHLPQPGIGEVLIKTRATGVCHTDLHVMRGEINFPIPAVMGHEMSGEIVGLGPDVELFASQPLELGNRVVSPFIMPCGRCHMCIKNKEDLCASFFNLNRLKGGLYDGKTRLFRASDNAPISMYSLGGMAEYAVVPATAVFNLPSSVPYAESAILGCAIFTAYGAIKHAAQLQLGETIAVLGTGGIGINCLQVARAFGADKIIAVDIDNEKLEKAKQHGATHVINAKEENPVDKLRSLTNGMGVDVCIEALGKPHTFTQAFQAVADGGRAVMVGIAPQGMLAEIEITRLVRRQIRLQGSFGGKARSDMPAIIRMLEKGQLDVKSAVTRAYSLKDAGKAYEDLHHGKITARAIVDFHKQ